LADPGIVKIRVWELAAGLVGALFSAIFILSNVWGVGLALLCADLLWVLTRIEIIERQAPAGRYATLRGRLGVARLALLGTIYGAVIYGWTILRSDHAEQTRVGVVALFALAGLAFLLLGEIKRSGEDALNWLVGGRAERHVGSRLDQLTREGWFVLHGYKREWGGDIDHLLLGPLGAYIVETKSYGFRRADLRRAAWNAAWLKKRIAVPWVTGVLCVNEEREPQLEGNVWVVSHELLLPWLRQQRQRPVDVERARQALAT
jgi:hypothetical protein